MSTRVTFAVVAPVLVEGAVDAFCGRPKSANPYNKESVPDAWWSWEWGHLEGSAQLADRGQREAARWLSEAAA